MKVHLNSMIILGRKPYYAGNYEDYELPPAIINDSSLYTVLDSSPSNIKQVAPTQELIKVQTVPNNTKEPGFPATPPKIISGTTAGKSKATDTPDKKPPVTTVNVNTATVEELNGLDNITVATAQKVVAEREKEKFTDIADLEKRVPLKGSQKWNALSDRLVFE